MEKKNNCSIKGCTKGACKKNGRIVWKAKKAADSIWSSQKKSVQQRGKVRNGVNCKRGTSMGIEILDGKLTRDHSVGIRAIGKFINRE